MEVYIPYVIGSTLTAFLGNIAYNYYTYDIINDRCGFGCSNLVVRGCMDSTALNYD